jgi:prepilin-type N-terminal cleavage/methylation domain-containing protein
LFNLSHSTEKLEIKQYVIIKLSMRLGNNKRGFTLVELMVVVAIISILASIVLISLASARGKTLDSRRVSDIKEIQTSLEEYLNDRGQLPNVGIGPNGENLAYIDNATSTNVAWDALKTELAPYITLPEPPNSTNFDYYAYRSNQRANYNYCLAKPGGGYWELPAHTISYLVAARIQNSYPGFPAFFYYIWGGDYKEVSSCSP